MNRFYFILTIVVVLLCPAISANAKHVLSDIDTLNVTIIHTGEEPNGLEWEILKDEVNNRLKEAGIEVFIPEPGVMYKLPLWPELTICVDMLKLEESQQYVFHTQTLLAKSIYVEVEPVLRQYADVWKTVPVMRAVSIQDMSAKVSDTVLEQVETFISAYRSANPQGVQPSQADKITPPVKVQTKPADKPAENKYAYVASKNSKVFHKPDCTWAKKIKSENLVRYNSRDEAVNAGRRPCKICNP